MMQLKQAWEVFEQSGTVNDYLKFKALEKQLLQEHTKEKGPIHHADYNGWHCSSGQTIKR